ncbi:MAG: VapC toxin family domain ribonuclease [Acidobacteria bacterium]|nr:VapC toxin family domain ribonuclease [Acidobacteriota bacterium]
MKPIVADTNAAIDFMRPDRPTPVPFREAEMVFLPLPVIGELLAGALASTRVDENLAFVHDLMDRSRLLTPDLTTATVYGRIRGNARVRDVGESKRNDFWIAALCLQHNVPLLTNDRGFDSIDGLTVIHW